MPPDPVFVADSMGKRFGRREVLKAASVWARPGRVTVLLGRNGCGKTTLLRCALGLERADFGTVRIAEMVVARPHLHELARIGVFYLPERGLLSRRRTVDEHVEILRAAFPHPARGARSGLFDLDALGDHLPDELSGGERRRAELALALLRNPTCLLADEPFLGIPPRDHDAVSRGIRTLAERGAGVIITGHEVDALLPVADEVVWMTAGTTHGLGSPEEAVRHHQFRREYLGPRGAGRFDDDDRV